MKLLFYCLLTFVNIIIATLIGVIIVFCTGIIITITPYHFEYAIGMIIGIFVAI